MTKARTPPPEPPRSDRYKLSEHLYYEISMALAYADALAEIHGRPSSTVSNAFLEAFTVHARQLVEFLWDEREPARPITWDGAYAADYFDPGEWKRLRPNRPQVLNRLMTAKVGWGVAHLTYARARSTAKDKEWPVGEMCAALVPVLRLFVSHVDRTQLDAQSFDPIEPLLDSFQAKYVASSATP